MSFLADRVVYSARFSEGSWKQKGGEEKDIRLSSNLAILVLLPW